MQWWNTLNQWPMQWMRHLAQANNNVPEEATQGAKKLFSEINTITILEATILVLFTYTVIVVSNKVVDWSSERVPLRYRLVIKQVLPFWKAILLGMTAILLGNLFFNLSPGNVLAVTGTVAVALGFAFKDYISSVIAGVVALFEQPYQVGDRIRINDYYGEVTGYGLRGIYLRTPDDKAVFIPHNKIWTEAIANANKGNLEAQVVTDFYFAHHIDVELVIQILYRVAQTSKYTQIKLPILVIMAENPWGTHFQLKSYPMDARDEFIYQTDLTRRAKKVFAKHKLQYPNLQGA